MQTYGVPVDSIIDVASSIDVDAQLDPFGITLRSSTYLPLLSFLAYAAHKARSQPTLIKLLLCKHGIEAVPVSTAKADKKGGSSTISGSRRRAERALFRKTNR